MKLIANIFVECANNKVLVKDSLGTMSLPSVIPNDNHTLRDHITTMLIGLGISDIVNDDIILYNIDDFIDDSEHTIVITFKAHTRKSSIQGNIPYKFISLSELKDSIDRFENEYDKFISRLYILNPYG